MAKKIPASICIKKRFVLLVFFGLLATIILIVGISASKNSKTILSKAEEKDCPSTCQKLQCNDSLGYIDCANSGNKTLCDDKVYTCSDPIYPHCCLSGFISVAPTIPPSPTPLTSCPGECMLYTTYNKNRKEAGGPTLAPGNLRENMSNCITNQNCSTSNNKFGNLNGCKVGTFTDNFGGTFTKDDQPFFDLSVTCAGNETSLFLGNLINLDPEKIPALQVCCADYQTYKNSVVSESVISPTPTPTPITTCNSRICVSSATSSCYSSLPTPTRRLGLNPSLNSNAARLTPTPTLMYQAFFAPTACPTTSSQYCCVQITPTSTPRPAQVTPTSTCNLPNYYCGKVAFSTDDPKKVDCDKSSMDSAFPTPCVYNASLVQDITINKNSFCCGPATDLPTQTPIPTIDRLPCPPKPTADCRNNCNRTYSSDMTGWYECTDRNGNVNNEKCCFIPSPTVPLHPNLCPVTCSSTAILTKCPPCGCDKIDLNKPQCSNDGKYCCVTPTPGGNCPGTCTKKGLLGSCPFGSRVFGSNNCASGQVCCNP